jgi:hypothetical protein
MIESNLKKVVQTFTDIVESIEILEIEEREGISNLEFEFVEEALDSNYIAPLGPALSRCILRLFSTCQ